MRGLAGAAATSRSDRLLSCHGRPSLHGHARRAPAARCPPSSSTFDDAMSCGVWNVQRFGPTGLRARAATVEDR
eukprot:2740810-Pyramimonas_sp.AAC.1